MACASPDGVEYGSIGNIERRDVDVKQRQLSEKTGKEVDPKFSAYAAHLVCSRSMTSNTSLERTRDG